MKRYTRYMRAALVLGSSLAIGCAATAFAASLPCTSLARSLSFGSSDSTSGGEVTKLQVFLKSAGYLSASPNGAFGPATLAAVKGFQSATGISATGTVGPLTRVAIQIKSCSAAPAATAPSSVPAASTPSSPSLSPAPAQGVSSPAAGTRLVIGQSQNIVWDATGSNQSVILEDDAGLARGFVTSNRSGTNSFAWRVGRVFSSKTQSNVMVAPGTYRIRVVGSGADQVSGLFALDAQPLVVTSFMPHEAVADNNSSILLYGTGFTQNVSVFIDDRYGLSATKLYSSPDGTIFVFALPPSTPVGTHSIILDNGFGVSIIAGQVTVTSSGYAY